MESPGVGSPPVHRAPLSPTNLFSLPPCKGHPFNWFCLSFQRFLLLKQVYANINGYSLCLSLQVEYQTHRLALCFLHITLCFQELSQPVQRGLLSSFLLTATAREALGRQLEAVKVEQPGPSSPASKALLLREDLLPSHWLPWPVRPQGLPACTSPTVSEQTSHSVLQLLSSERTMKGPKASASAKC